MTILLIVVLLITSAIVFLTIVSVNENRSAEAALNQERESKREEEAEYLVNRVNLMEEVLADYPLKSSAAIDNEIGFVGMDTQGTRLRIVQCQKQGASLSVIDDETIPLSSVTSVTIDQPDERRTITHTEKTPVPVGSRRSPVGRAVVGGLVAGPLGAVVGGMSGLGGKSKIEQVETHRRETVYVRSHPKLIVGLDNLSRPRRVLVFGSVSETNDWSARIFTAMNRVRPLR